MLVRDIKRLALFVGPFAVLLLITYALWDPDTSEQLRSHANTFLGKHGATTASEDGQAPLQESPAPLPPPPLAPPSNTHSPASGQSHPIGAAKLELPQDDDDDKATDATHHE